MSDNAKISIRLSPELQALLSARLRQGRRVSEVIRDALEAYLGIRPLDRPPATTLFDTLAAVAVRLEALASDLADLRARLERLEARGTPAARIRPRQRARPTQGPAFHPTDRPPHGDTPAAPAPPRPRAAWAARRALCTSRSSRCSGRIRRAYGRKSSVSISRRRARSVISCKAW
jgi:Arc/MetJ-type ribon-helix-helix transcriptional regulator